MPSESETQRDALRAELELLRAQLADEPALNADDLARRWREIDDHNREAWRRARVLAAHDRERAANDGALNACARAQSLLADAMQSQATLRVVLDRQALELPAPLEPMALIDYAPLFGCLRQVAARRAMTDAAREIELQLAQLEGECPTCGGDPYVQPCDACGATGHEGDEDKKEPAPAATDAGQEKDHAPRA